MEGRQSETVWMSFAGSDEDVDDSADLSEQECIVADVERAGWSMSTVSKL